MTGLDESHSTPSTTRNPILWGAYLACSWTWCIGMFLPALLMRDMGWNGFLIFAIPNVLGAAAMGWILRSKLESVRFVEKHPTAIWWFSTITLAFHVFWLMWILHFLRAAFPVPQLYLIIVGAIVVSFVMMTRRAVKFERMPQVAMVLIVLSLGVCAAAFILPDLSYETTAMVNGAPKSIAPLWMLPVTIFGFALCPYLDITFHHARQQLDTQSNGRLGFTIGFVVFFALMIVLTTRYSGAIIAVLDGRVVNPTQTQWIGAAILLHILCQWVFTVLAHLDKIRTIPGASQSRQQGMMLIIIAGGLIGIIAPRLPMHADLRGGEIIYRSFLGAYGLVFPTYLLYLAILSRKENAKFAQRLMWIAILGATPMFWMGFMERDNVWLIGGIGVVALGALVLVTQRSKYHLSSAAQE